MSRSCWLIVLSPLIWLCTARDALAGMPSAQLVLTELGKRRIEEVSFFLVGFLLMSALVQWLWNYLQMEIPSLPRLTYRRTVVLMLLWGLVMTVVLTLISGARELMTPAAWEPDGVTHKLKSRPSAQPTDLNLQRRAKLEALRTALWQFAATREGRFPAEDELTSIPVETWLVQAGGTMKFIYVEGLSAKSAETILAYEPEIYDEGQLVLMTSGRVAMLADFPVATK